MNIIFSLIRRCCSGMRRGTCIVIVYWLLNFCLVVTRCCTETSPSTTVSTTTCSLEETVHKILSQLQAWQTEYLSSNDPSLRSRPFILASFAQSLEGQIAPWKIHHDNDDTSTSHKEETTTTTTTTTSNYPLSGPESLVVTHAIRSIHDGILVGGRTLSMDNPQLNNRFWRSNNNNNNQTGQQGRIRRRQQPIPFVLDTRLEHVLALGPALRAQNLVVCCGEDSAVVFLPETTTTTTNPPDVFSQITSSLSSLSSSSLSSSLSLLPCKVITTGSNNNNNKPQLDLLDLLRKLRTEYAIQTLMVEGGAAVLTSLFQLGLVDAICITIAPKALCGGVAPRFFGSHTSSIIDFRHQSSMFVPVGSDCIFLSRFPTK